MISQNRISEWGRKNTYQLAVTEHRNVWALKTLFREAAISEGRRYITFPQGYMSPRARLQSLVDDCAKIGTERERVEVSLLDNCAEKGTEREDCGVCEAVYLVEVQRGSHLAEVQSGLHLVEVQTAHDAWTRQVIFLLLLLLLRYTRHRSQKVLVPQGE